MSSLGMLALGLVPHATGHFVLNEPLSRNGLSCNDHACQTPKNNTGIANGGAPNGNSHAWYTNNVAVDDATLSSKEYHEFLTQCQKGGQAPEYKDCDWTLTKPWRAPGRGAVATPCGLIFGKGADGATLDPVPDDRRATWIQGGMAEVAFGIATNHGGGYSYRLCPATETLTEECFQRMPLFFADNTTDILDTSGQLLGSLPALRLRRGTFPENSEWSRNPIPTKANMFPAPFGLVGSPRQINIVDRIKVPEDLAPGDYVLGFRLDCEQTAEVWSNCADIKIASKGSPLVVL